jgi:hypothetical protein
MTSAYPSGYGDLYVQTAYCTKKNIGDVDDLHCNPYYKNQSTATSETSRS